MANSFIPKYSPTLTTPATKHKTNMAVVKTAQSEVRDAAVTPKKNVPKGRPPFATGK